MLLKLSLTAHPMVDKENPMKYIAYIGSNACGENSGLRVAEVNAETGSLSIIQRLGDFDSAPYPAVSADRKNLVAGGSNPAAPVPQRGMTASFKIQPDGKLEPVNASVAVCQNPPCHVCFSPDKRFAYAAHYGEGRLTAYAIAEDASIWGPVQVLQHEGCGPFLPNQESARVHYCTFTPDGKYLCAVDLGLDIIRVYRPDENGQLSHVKDVPIVKGAGSRHMVFSHDGSLCYVVSELKCRLTTFAYNDGEFTRLETISTLINPDTKDRHDSSAIRISADGRYLFAGNRHVNNVAVFKLEDGMPRLIANVPCAFPRDLNILPNDKFLYVCGQDENVVEIFSFDSERCELKPTGERLELPLATAVVFMEV